MLDKQINLFKVDTNAFLHNKEKKELESSRQKIKEIKSELELAEDEQLKKELKKSLNKEKKEYKNFIIESAKFYADFNEKNKKEDRQIRELDSNSLYYYDENEKIFKNRLYNVVSMFDSTLSRSFNLKIDELTEDIFIVEVYYYDIARDLINNGFNFKGKHYVYFSSSAGQIRTKKTVFVEEEKYNQCKLKLMCGLTIEKINELGGMNINKFLAYLALSNSATDLWDNILDYKFNIDDCIVVEDFETYVSGFVDNINTENYEIEENVTMEIPIPHTDGCGMILKECSDKNFMVRLPWIKGLLGSFDFKKFALLNNSTKITDIWGKEYDIIEDNIKVIFTKSQLKMYKYYSSWKEYKENFLKYNCEACICNIEEDRIKNAKINYQMLQSLYKMTEKEISEICLYPNKKILQISDSLEHMLNFYGTSLIEEREYDDFFQKSLAIYPEIIKDISCKEDLRDLRNSLVNKYKSGRLDIRGKFTFVLPDLYAFCENLFLKIEKPNGLLDNYEVFCNLYRNKKELDCLRSPSLYIEHAIRNNVVEKVFENQKLEDWFTTNAIYVSTKDLISRILQMDCDGDRLLVLSDHRIISIAKRCMNGINPLYYEMKKAKSEIITSNSIYNGLRLAFTGGNIGVISNDITKIWNQNNIGEKELKAIRWLCMETNFTIDYAKTLFKLTRPKYVDDILKEYHNKKLPYFFQYAKDKDYLIEKNEKIPTLSKKSQVSLINNSTMNLISNQIIKSKIMFGKIKNLEKVDYKMMIQNKDDDYSNEKINECYTKWNKKYGNNLKSDKDNKNNTNFNAIINTIKEDFGTIEKDKNKIVNSLVKMLYEKNTTTKKKLLWYLYGETIYNNIKENIYDGTECCNQCGKRLDKIKLKNGQCIKCLETSNKNKQHCVQCGKVIKINSNGRPNKYCDECAKDIQRKIDREYRKNKRLSKYVE